MNKYILNTIILLSISMILLGCRMGGDNFQHKFPQLPLGACRGKNEYPAKLTPTIYPESIYGAGVEESAGFDLIGNFSLDYVTSTSIYDINERYFTGLTSDDPQNSSSSPNLHLHNPFCAVGVINEQIGLTESGDLDKKIMAFSNCQPSLNESTMILTFSADYVIQTREQYDSESTANLKHGVLNFSCPYQLFDGNGDLIPESTTKTN